MSTAATAAAATTAACAMSRGGIATTSSSSLLRHTLRVAAGPSSSSSSSSSIPSSRPSSRPRRSIHTTPRSLRYSFLISHSFQGKPPDPEPPQPGENDGQQDGKATTSSSSSSSSPPRKPPQPKQIGWPPSTAIGQWVSTLLGPGGSAGEDSLMVVRSLSHPHDVALGVADGVGSWSQNGVDPALFSQALMYHASQAFERAKEGARDEDARPVRLLSKAYGEVMQEKGVPAGSSTATILTLESETGVLRSANLGDSGFMVLREDAMAGNPGGEGAAGAVDQGDDLGRGRGVPGKRPLPGTLYRSAPQQWAFNAPNQLSKYPPSMLAEMKRANGGREPDLGDDSNPRTANEWSVRLQPGDIVVVASDGVWDNVWGKEWVGLVKYLTQRHREHFKERREGEGKGKGEGKTVEKWEEEKTLVEVIAYNALQYTLLCQFSETKRSPFEAEAERYRIRYPGGKVDDISIVVAMVVKEEDD